MYAKYHIAGESIVIDGDFWRIDEERGGGWIRISRSLGWRQLFKRERRTVRVTDGF